MFTKTFVFLKTKNTVNKKIYREIKKAQVLTKRSYFYDEKRRQIAFKKISEQWFVMTDSVFTNQEMIENAVATGCSYLLNKQNFPKLLDIEIAIGVNMEKNGNELICVETDDLSLFMNSCSLHAYNKNFERQVDVDKEMKKLEEEQSYILAILKKGGPELLEEIVEKIDLYRIDEPDESDESDNILDVDNVILFLKDFLNDERTFENLINNRTLLSNEILEKLLTCFKGLEGGISNLDLNEWDKKYDFKL